MNLGLASSGPGTTSREADCARNISSLCWMAAAPRSAGKMCCSGAFLAAQSKDSGSPAGIAALSTRIPQGPKRPTNSTQTAGAGHLVSPYKCHSTPSFPTTERAVDASAGAKKTNPSQPIKWTHGSSPPAERSGNSALSEIGRKGDSFIALPLVEDCLYSPFRF